MYECMCVCVCVYVYVYKYTKIYNIHELSYAIVFAKYN